MDTRIVAIDNDESSRLLLTACLNAAGLQVVTSSYTHINFAALEQPRPDLIILNFARADGDIAWNMLQKLKMASTTASIPILATTSAFHLSEEVRNYLVTRHIGVLHKPFDVPFFVKLVKKMIMDSGPTQHIFSSDHILPILVVEDNEDLSDVLTTVLKLEGYKVLNAANGQEALNSVSLLDHCLILLDISMPIMNGYEFLAAYHEQKRPHSPVIILSAESNIHEHVLPPFVVDVLAKPYDIHEVLALVKKYAQPV